MTPTIGLLGDVMLGRGVAEHLAEVPPEDVWSAELRELCLDCDLVIGNLECCLSERGDPTTRIRGKPFFFRAPPRAVESLRAIGVAAVGLANNHALDFGDCALLDTLELLGEAGIAAAGAGTEGGPRGVVRFTGARPGLDPPLRKGTATRRRGSRSSPPRSEARGRRSAGPEPRAEHRVPSGRRCCLP